MMQKSTVPYAVTEDTSRGRKTSQRPHSYRSEFQRDRDRIIHSEAFRRLEGKTQVFSPGINDHYRTRLTHSIEVAQIGRTIALALGLNETLTEAICLAHDIGHSPFGHNGEAALNKLMADSGGFEHNAQALRIVDFLENPYPDCKGLNLMYETRLALAKHSSPYDHSSRSDFPETQCSLEGQIADAADRIAYNCHDLEDALRSKIVTEKDTASVFLFSDVITSGGFDRIENSFIRKTRIIKGIMDQLVTDCIKTSQTLLSQFDPPSLEAVYQANEKYIRLSDSSNKHLAELESFLYNKVYMNAELKHSGTTAAANLKRLFIYYCKKPDRMPRYYSEKVDTFGLQRSVCDYIAGMTDHYCQECIQRI